MKLIRYLGVAFKSIISHKLRSGLTMLGIIIGVTAVLTTTGIGSGAAASIASDIESQGTNLITVRSGGSGGASSSTLTMNDAEALADPQLHPEIAAVAPEYSATATLIYGDNEGSYSVVGATPNLVTVRNMTVAKGSFLSAEHLATNERVVILGSDVATDLFGVADPVGQAVRINTGRFEVIGVLEEAGGPFGSSDTQAYVPLPVAQGRLFNAPRYRGHYTIDTISIQAVSEEELDAAELDIEQTLRMRHGLTADEDNDFSLSNQANLLDLANTIATTLQAFLGSIGAISLLVGGIGIMNIMLVSVTERTREIGLRKALGAYNRDILFQFLVEALVLCSLGGLVGTSLGFGLAFLLNQLPFMPFTVIIGTNAIVLALAVSTACGFIFGIYPAMRATRLDPIDALRFE